MMLAIVMLPWPASCTVPALVVLARVFPFSGYALPWTVQGTFSGGFNMRLPDSCLHAEAVYVVLRAGT